MIKCLVSHRLDEFMDMHSFMHGLCESELRVKFGTRSSQLLLLLLSNEKLKENPLILWFIWAKRKKNHMFIGPPNWQWRHWCLHFANDVWNMCTASSHFLCENNSINQQWFSLRRYVITTHIHTHSFTIIGSHTVAKLANINSVIAGAPLRHWKSWERVHAISAFFQWENCTPQFY